MSHQSIVKMNVTPYFNFVKYVFIWQDVKHSQHIGVLEIVHLRCDTQVEDITEHTNVECQLFTLMINLSTIFVTYRSHVYRLHNIIEHAMPNIMWLH